MITDDGKAKRVIEKNFFMTVSTADIDGSPWISPLYYAFDDSYTFYWYSSKLTKHSGIITRNNRVAVTIFNSNLTENDLGGVFFTGKAYELDEKELSHALDVYFTRTFPHDPDSKQQMIARPNDFLGDSALRMYKFVPEKVYVTGEATKWNGKWIDVRTEIDLLIK
jgi:uncharacterized protein YhbP (UPF0306 family)